MRNLDPAASKPFRHADTYKEAGRPDRLTDADLDEAISDAQRSGRLDLPNASGVYVITNRLSRRVYVGRATKMRSRTGVHFSQLKSGTHSNAAWLADYRAHGPEAFGAAVLTCVVGGWVYLAERAALMLVRERDCYNVQNVDFLGRANLSGAYLDRLTDEIRQRALRKAPAPTPKEP